MFGEIILGLVLVLLVEWLGNAPFYWCTQDIYWIVPRPLNTLFSYVRPFSDLSLEFYNQVYNNKVVGYHKFGRPALYVSDPQYINQILEDVENFSPCGLFFGKGDVLHRGAFASEAKAWGSARSEILPLLSKDKIKTIFQIVKDTVDGFIGFSKQGVVDSDLECQKLSTEVMASVIGFKPDSFLYDFRRDFSGLFWRFKMLIGREFPFLYNILGLCSISKKTQKNFCSVIRKELKRRRKSDEEKNDIMQVLTKHIDDEDGDGTKFGRFHENEVISHCLTLFLGGNNTLSCSLTFLLYELARNIDEQGKLREEIQRTLNDSGVLSYEKMVGMDYLNAVYLETVRKYPASPEITRICTKSTHLGEVKISKEIPLIIPVLGMHRDPSSFPEPDNFIPERFSSGSTRELTDVFIPFGIGPRQCIGKKVAEITMKIVVCKLLMKFKLSSLSEISAKITSTGLGHIMIPKNPVKIQIDLIKSKTS